MTFQLTWLMI